MISHLETETDTRVWCHSERKEKCEMNEQNANFRGNGGFGTEVILQLIIAIYGWWVKRSGQHGARFQAMDTDPAKANQFGPGKFYYLGAVPIRDLLEQMWGTLKVLPDVARRVGDPDKLNQALGTEVVYQGTQHCRPIALLALVYHLIWDGRKLLDFLIRPIREIYAFSGGSHQNSGDKQRAMLPLIDWSIGSICGGQNSGTYLDVAYWLQNLLSRLGITQYQMNAILAVPDVFPEVDQERLGASAFAALKELVRIFATRVLKPLTYGRNLRIPRVNPPFTFTYLISGTNALGRVFDNFVQVAQSVAQFLRIISGGPMAGHYQAILQNVLRELRYPNFCSSFGCYVIELPVRELQVLFAHRLVQRLVRHHLLRQQRDSDKRAKSSLTDFLHEVKVTAGLGRFFGKDREGKPIAIDLRPFRKLKGKRLKPALDAYQAEQLPRWETALDEKIVVAIEVLFPALERWVLTLINESDGGLLQAQSFLGVLATWLEEGSEQLRKWAKALQEETARFHQRQARRRFELPLFRDRRLRRQKQRELKLALGSLQVSAQIRLLTRLADRVSSFKVELQGWTDALKALEAALHTREDAFATGRIAHRPVCVENALSTEQEDELYERGLPDALALASQGLRFGWGGDKLILDYGVGETTDHLDRRHLLTDHGYCHPLVQYGQALWESLEQLSLEDILRERNVDPEERLEYLLERAAPLILVDRLKQQTPVIVRMVLGTERGPTGLFESIPTRADLSVVETGNRHRIEMVVTWHGINPFALTQIEDWERAYQARYPIEPLHVFPERELADKDADATFYRLLGFGAVTREGAELFALNFGPGQGAHLDAPNIRDLLRLFSLQADLVEQAKAFLGRRETGLEPQEAAAILRQNVQDLSIPESPEVEKKAKAEIRRYAKMFRTRSARRSSHE